MNLLTFSFIFYQIKSNLKNFYSAPYNNGRERLTKYIGLIIKWEVKYNIGVS